MQGVCTVKGESRAIMWFSVSATATGGAVFFTANHTAHEMLRPFGLINMNGRVYDPLTSRFLSPDNYVQAPYNPQNYNRYAYCLNNPLKYTDPDGEVFVFSPVVIGAVIGAIAGGYMGYRIADAKGYDFGDWQTYGYILGGAAIGALAGGVSAGIALQGEFLANTMAIVFGSTTFSIGMTLLSNGMVQPSVSFGAASYDFYSQQWNGIWRWDSLSTMERIGYASGLYANLTDVWAFYMGAYNSADELELQTRNHSQIYDPKNDKMFSWGARQPNGEPYAKSLQNIFNKLNPVTDYEGRVNWFDKLLYRTVTIHKVNLDKYYQYINQLPKEGQFYRLASFFPIKGMHCTIAASRALLHAGVFNLPILRMPILLDLQMRIRDYTYLSYYMLYDY